MELSRRDFLKASSILATALGVDATGLLKMDKALALESAAGGLSVIWLQGQACTGCSVSFLNSIYYATSDDLLLNTLDLNYHTSVMAAAGSMASASAEAAYAKGNYVLIVEGAVPANGAYCSLWPGMTMAQAVTKYAAKALYVIAVGACASYGGVAAAAPNLTKAAGLSSSYNGKPVVKLPGCPVNPDWLVGTVAYILANGKAPALDSYNRPTDYYGKTVHSQCPLREYYEEGEFAAKLGDKGCLHNLGCRGPVTYCDCPTRRWNSPAKGTRGVNWCIGAGGPCYGCTTPGFPDVATPFYWSTTSASQAAGGTTGGTTGASTTTTTGG